jgi:hypothetical protein
VSGQLYVPANISPGKEPPVPIGLEAEWAPVAVLTLWRRENSCPCQESDPGRPARRYTNSVISWDAHKLRNSLLCSFPHPPVTSPLLGSHIPPIHPQPVILPYGERPEFSPHTTRLSQFRHLVITRLLPCPFQAPCAICRFVERVHTKSQTANKILTTVGTELLQNGGTISVCSGCQ